jgi:trimeric autotransporter adhesin
MLGHVSLRISGSRMLAVAAASAAVVVAPGGASVPAAAVAPSGSTAAWIISTVAGGVGGPAPATGVAIDFPCGVAFAGGNMYIGDGFAQKVNARTGRLTTPAGAVRRGSIPSGEQVPVGDGGPATDAVTSACGVAMDQSGNLVLADSLDRRVRVVAARSGTFYGQSMTAGDIYTVAGTGTGAKISGNNRPATKANLADPVDVQVDKTGNLVVSDSGSRGSPAEVQVVAAVTGTFYGHKMTAGNIYKIAGNAKVARVSGGGGPAVKAGLGAAIGQLAFDQAGNVVVADTTGNSIRVVAVTSGTFYGQKMTAGDIYRVAGDGKPGFSGDGGPATKARLRHPLGVAVDGSGNLVIADTYNDRVRVVAATSGTFYGRKMTAGDIYRVAGCGRASCKLGDGGPALAARLIQPDAVAVDGTGSLIVAEHGAGRVSQDRRVRLVAARSGTFYGQKMTAGDMYTVAGDGFRGYSGNDGPALKAVMMTTSSRMVIDKAGNLVIAAGENNRIRVVPATTGTFYGQKMTVGHIYTVAGGGAFPYGGDGGPATKAGMNFPDGLAIDAAGNLIIADEGNNRVRVVAVESGTFYGVKMTKGDMYTVAGDGKAGFSGDGGPALKATLRVVSGVAVDGAGNLVICDEGNNRVRVVAVKSGTFYGQRMTADHIYTVAGDGKAGFSGDGGPATQAELQFPKDVTVDGNGNLVIADEGNNRVRVVAATTGTFYGVAMTAGDIYTVAGDGAPGFSGDGGPATQAELVAPSGIAVNAAGDLFIADRYRVRMVSP